MTTATLEKVETTTDYKSLGPAYIPTGKTHTYYGIEYRFSVKQMAAQVNTSVRTIKTYLELSAMGYGDKLMAGWTAARCFAHAGKAKRKPAPTKASIDEYKSVIIAYREQMADAEYEITRLREMVVELGGDLDKF